MQFLYGTTFELHEIIDIHAGRVNSISVYKMFAVRLVLFKGILCMIDIISTELMHAIEHIGPPEMS